MTEKGLADVVAAQTSISDIDGQMGRLFYVGYDIHELAPVATFEEVWYLLHNLRLPTQTELEDLNQQLVDEREIVQFIEDLMPILAHTASPMSMLRTTVSAMSAHDPDGWDKSFEASYRKAIRITSRLATVLAYYERVRNGLDLVRPNPKLSHAANILWMLKGMEPDEDSARVLDMCLVLHADHTMNASTFTARVVASTLSDIHSATTAAIAALKGPLHGGANEQVMKMLLEIDEPSKAPDYVKAKFAKKEKLMGFGHRVYKTEDPRATHLRRLSQQLGEQTGEPKWYEISKKIEETVMEEKGLYPNVDFYAASVYHALGIPTDLFTPIFACSRVSGWTAHIREQYHDNRIIRPDSEYIGPRGNHWVPIEERG
jgi:citrate synthase